MHVLHHEERHHPKEDLSLLMPRKFESLFPRSLQGQHIIKRTGYENCQLAAKKDALIFLNFLSYITEIYGDKSEEFVNINKHLSPLISLSLTTPKKLA